jgi:2-polyprenyl-3-methyl-5-hydroxy-6-metoxy-1,4-benzoquinol methylase
MDKKTIEKSHKEYNEDYYERGISTGKSGYDNYKWLPEMTIKFVHKIIKKLNLREGDIVLDFGCAKGFMVKALRILDINAYGFDISEYSIKNLDPDVREYCRLSKNGKIPFNKKFNWVIAKDVFEHLYESELNFVLEDISKYSKNLFVIVPLGKNNKYVVPLYNLDITHKLSKSREWWEKKFEEKNWKVDSFSYLISGMKDNWKHYEKGNGFFFLKKN